MTVCILDDPRATESVSSRRATATTESNAGFSMHWRSTWPPMKPVLPVTMTFMLYREYMVSLPPDANGFGKQTCKQIGQGAGISRSLDGPWVPEMMAHVEGTRRSPLVSFFVS